MKKQSNKPPGLLKKAIGVAAGFILLATLLPGTAAATTAANAVITNTATVNYDDSGGNVQPFIEASVNVTVNLVTAQPTLSTPVNATIASGLALDYTYTITNNSNGPDAYALTVTPTLGVGITSQTHFFRNAADTGDITSITLGASSVATAAIIGATAITVPNDGAAGSEVNGILAGDVVVIGGTSYTVASVVDNAAGTSTINLAVGLVAAVSVGDLIGEQGTFISRTTPIATINNSTYTLDVTADDQVSAAAAPTHQTTTTVLVISLSVTKYVQNVTNPVALVGPAFVTLTTGLGTGSLTYYDSGVTGKPGDTLEYVIAITNAAASATATDIVISDPVPNFTAQTGNIALDPGTGVFTNVAITADNGDFAEANATIVYIYAGDGTLAGEGDDTAAGVGTGTGGRLAGGTTTYGAFQVQIQ